jgi:hypothetical protein
VQNNRGNGIALYDGVGNTIFHSSIFNNNTDREAHGGVAVFDGCATIHWNLIDGNQCFGVYAAESHATEYVDATDNWWGADSGPSGQGTGSGDAVSEFVLFDPWLGGEGSSPTTLFVNGAIGDDANPGDFGAPLRTVHAAINQINAAPAGAYTLYVAPGLYNAATEGSDTPLVVHQDLHIIGYDAIINGTDAEVWTHGLIIPPGTANVTLEGLTIEQFENGKGVLVAMDGGCLTLNDTEIRTCETGVGLVGAVQNLIDLDLSRITDNTDAGIVVVEGSSDNVINNGLIFLNPVGIKLDTTNASPDNNRFEGVQVFDNALNGVEVLAGEGTRFNNSTFLNNNTSRAGFGGIAILNGCASVNWSMIEGNQCHGVYADEAFATQFIDATYNWWGDANGPSGAGPGPVFADAVSEFVLYAPWLGEADELVGEPTGGDVDGDGLPDVFEIEIGLSPVLTDTDGDTIPDGEEDADGDGWTNKHEFQAGSNALNPNLYPAVTVLYAGYPEGDDTNLGTLSYPLQTIHAAIAVINALPGVDFTLHLAPRRYATTPDADIQEPDTTLVLNKNLILYGAGAVLDGVEATAWQEGLVADRGVSNLALHNLTLVNFKYGLVLGTDGGCVDLVDALLQDNATGIALIENDQTILDLTNSIITGSTEVGLSIGTGSVGNHVRNGFIQDNLNDGIRLVAGNDYPRDNTLERIQILRNAKHGIVLMDGVGTTIRDCQILENNSSRTGWGGLAVLTGCTSVQWNIIQGNQCHGLYADEAADLAIDGNLITNNTDNGVRLAFTTNVDITSNTIADNVGGVVIEDGSAPDIWYNIIWGNMGAGFTDMDGLGLDPTQNIGSVEFNDIGTTNVGALPANNIGDDPDFRDAAGGDYTLLGYSPAIDATDKTVPGRDLLLIGRPYGPVWDMGAYESTTARDADEDGLADWWEEQIVAAFGLTSITAVTVDGDRDGDGIINQVEYDEGYDPTAYTVTVAITQIDGDPAVNPYHILDARDVVTVTVTVRNADSVEAVRNGDTASPFAGTSNGDGTWDVVVDVLGGDNDIEITASSTDNPGTPAIDESGSASDIIRVVKDNVNPVVTINDPTQGLGSTNNATLDLTGGATDDTAVASVTWTLGAVGGDAMPSPGGSYGIWSIAGIQLSEGVLNTITVTATDLAGNVGTESYQIQHELGVVYEEGADESSQSAPLPDDPLDPDEDDYLTADEINPLCGTDPNDQGSFPANTNGVFYPTDTNDPLFDWAKVKTDDQNNIIGSYLLPDCVNPAMYVDGQLDVDMDGLPDAWEQQIIDAEPGDDIDTIQDVDPQDNFDNDDYDNGTEYENQTDPTVPQFAQFAITVLETNAIGTPVDQQDDYNDWLPQYNTMLMLQVDWLGAPALAPATVEIKLEDVTSYPGRAVNDPDPAVVGINNYPTWYQFNGKDFGLTQDPTVKSYDQGPLPVEGDNGRYTIYLQSHDFGGRARFVVTDLGTDSASTVWLPKGSGENFIGSAWEHDAGPVRLDPNADIDLIQFDNQESYALYNPQVGDDFTNFEEYRGVTFIPHQIQGLAHMRLDPRRKNLFVRAEGFDDPERDPYEVPTPAQLQDPNYYPFWLGDAYKNAGIDIINTTGWGHDATIDGTFFLYYREGVIIGINRFGVTGQGTNWNSTWPGHEWEFSIMDDNGDPVKWESVKTWSAENLFLDVIYNESPQSYPGQGYAIRRPLPHINVMIVRHSTDIVLEDTDGEITFDPNFTIGPSPQFPQGLRWWTWSIKGFCTPGSTAKQYALPFSLQKPLDHYFGDLPYIQGNSVWTPNGWAPPVVDIADMRLQPLSRGEDPGDTGTEAFVVDGYSEEFVSVDENNVVTYHQVLPGNTPNGQWDGNQRIRYRDLQACEADNPGNEGMCAGLPTWESSGELSPFNIDSDDAVELPYQLDPEAIDPASEQDEFGNRYTKVWVLRHTTTHEMGHAMGGVEHSLDPKCLMFEYSNNWARPDYICDWFKARLKVHNQIR